MVREPTDSGPDILYSLGELGKIKKNRIRK
jgi:hypothetical protein